MDDTRFDAWTRRRFGLAAGGLLTTALGLRTNDATRAKHRHKKRHCKKHETRCGKQCVKGECCPDKTCGPSGLRCACGRTIEGRAFCFADALVDCEQCASTAACGEAQACVQLSGPCLGTVTAVCLPACGSLPG